MPLRRFTISLLLLGAFACSVRAKIGDAPAVYAKRYGPAVREAFDAEGSGLSVYRTEEFREIRVTFKKGASEKEVYKYVSGESVPQRLVDAIQAENKDQHIFSGFDQVTVESLTDDSVDYLARPSGAEKTYSGIVKEKTVDDARWAVLFDHGAVVEVPVATAGYPQQVNLTSGQTYTVTMLEELADDINTVIGVVSKREHVDWFDAVDDAGLAGIHQLIRITQGSTVIFDRSICSMHHEPMELRTVKIAYGMLGAASWAESYCMGHFPHFRNFAAGGCVVQDAETTSIYICPKCVAECKEYAQQHPEKVKPD